MIPPSIWRDISMDFILRLTKLGNKSFIMVVVDRLSKYVHLCSINTHLQHPLWLKFSWISSLGFMACHILLFLIATQLSPAIFGKNYSRYKEPNCISTQLIIPILMVKLKLSTSVWRLIWGVFPLKGKINGINGYH